VRVAFAIAQNIFDVEWRVSNVNQKQIDCGARTQRRAGNLDSF
jgi:hypothetical protein